jgi:TonB-linked SusC/RagA family outer membrane protein
MKIMKYIKIIAALCTILAFSPMISLGQNAALIEVNAIVLGSANEPLEGAVITNTSDNARVVTNVAGSFSIQVAENTPLTISASGYTNAIVIASADLKEIFLQSDVALVQVPFRRVAQQDLVGGVSVVNMQDLMRKGYTSNPLEGLVTELGGFNDNSIWGRGAYLIVVDGIPREIGNIRTTEVDQISVLKGAGAVALYGPQAANGVIYITTKRGSRADQQVDVRINSGIMTPKQYSNYLGSADYMTLYNEARLNDGSALLYSQEQIEATASGVNPYRYPSIDFYSDEFLKNFFNRSDVTTEIYGGDKNARYYTNIGYMRQGSLLNAGEGANSYDQRFNLRGNVDVNLTDWLVATVDAAAIFAEGRSPQSNFFEQASVVRPNRFVPLLPINRINMKDSNRFMIENTDNVIDGQFLLGGTQQDLTNPFANIFAGGYNKGINRQFLFNTTMEAGLNPILQGLSFKTRIGLDYRTSYSQGYRHQYQIFEPVWRMVDGIEVIDSLINHNTRDIRSSQQYIENSAYRQVMYFSGQLDYQRSFDNRHNLFMMLLANGYQITNSGQYQKTPNTNLGYFVGYNYLNRYYVDFNSSLMYTNKLAPGNRLALSPVLSLGWRISDENFMQGITAVNHLKLNSTIGRIYTDMDIEDHYLYSSRYNYRNTNWYSWAAEMGIDVTAAIRGANPELEAPHRDELSVGMEASLFNRFIDVEANVFSLTYKGGIIQATTLFPNYLMTGWPASSFVPYVNYNEERRSGLDFNVRLKPQTGNVSWIFGLAGTFYDTEILKRSDIYEFAYREREGRPIDGVWGFQSAGLFYDQADIDNSPRQTFGTVKPGDIKYVDQNGDGIIDINDEIYLGKGGWYGAPNTLGVNVSANWGNFTLYAQGVGRWGGYGIRNRTTDWIYGDRKYTDVVYDRWAHYTHPVTGEIVDTRATASYPRLTTFSSENNFRTSDFWKINNDRFDIARIQLTYSLPQSILGNMFLNNVDIYVAGSNLLTIAKERKYLETNVGQAPQMRFYNVGVSASF